MSWWKKDNNNDAAHENEICVVCLHSVWDCTCVDPRDEQYITVGQHTKKALAELREFENARKGEDAEGKSKSS